MRIKGIGRSKAQRMVALAELTRRMFLHRKETAPMMDKPEVVTEFLRPYVTGLTVEKFWVLCRNRRNRLIKLVELTSGLADTTLVHPREVFRAAIREGGCCQIVVGHNHPSGDPSPSSNDFTITRTLRAAATTIGIGLLDHVVVGTSEADPTRKGYFSFREAGVV